MARKLPADFDPECYRASYPDVALSGLTPAEHYLRFGRVMGRRFTAASEQTVGPEKPKSEQRNPQEGGYGESAQPKREQSNAVPPADEKNAAAPEVAPGADRKLEVKARQRGRPVAPRRDEKPEPTSVPENGAGKPQAPKARTKPIIDRPGDFEREQALVRPAPPKAGADTQGRFPLAALAAEVPSEVSEGIAAYRRMFRLEESGSAVRLGAAQLLDGAAKIDNAWLAGDGVLRLMIADHAGEAAGWAIRAYQANQAEPAQLYVLGAGALLPQRGPVLVEFEMQNSLMPLLVEASDPEGAIKEMAVIPFPSLLPGGLHNAELRAVQSAPNPMDAFWVTSDLFLRELVGGRDSPDLSISHLTRTGPRQPGEAIDQWLRALFGFTPSDRKANSLERSGCGAELKLPHNWVPTIGSIVSRSLSGRGTGPYLVTDSETLRPRWSVVLPPGWDAAGGAPVLDRAAAIDPPSVHLAIAFRARAVPALPKVPPPPAAPRSAKRRSGRKISVFLDATDANRSDGAIAALSSALGNDLDLLVRLGADLNSYEPPIGAPWKRFDGDLRTAAAEAKHQLLLTISDRVDWGDAPVLDTLATMLENEAVGSASCVLLREVSLKKQKVLQPASGGLFPAAVSFATAPSLIFAEPDVLEPLPEATYPVVANTFEFTLWRTSAVAALPEPPRPLPRSAADIQIGLALAEGGLVSLCTTQVSARLHGDYMPRDAIDPIGQSRLAPSDWQQLLGRVTLLRQLF